MSDSDLSAELRRRAEDSARKILQAADAEAERIKADAEAGIEGQKRAALESREREYLAEARAKIAGERHEAMRSILLARTRLVERVLQRARALLPEAARTQQYSANLETELSAALEYVSGEEVVVHCSHGLVSEVRGALRGTATVPVEPMTDEGTGFVVIGDAGAVRVDGTLETRLRRLEQILSIEIHQRAAGS